MRVTIGFIAAFSVTLAMQTAAFAEDSGTMRCKGGIVSIGDSAGEVLGKCGQPAITSQSSRKVVEKGQTAGQQKTITNVLVDLWTFNFGKNEFQYRLELQDGRITRIEGLDYGY
jgi:hypothetical protein